MSDPDAEFAAMQSVFSALDPLDEEAQARVINYVSSRLGVVGATKGQSPSSRFDEELDADSDAEKFEEFGELFDALDPSTDAERALAAAYWSCVYEEEESFDSQSLNKMLKNLGHGVSNITRALGTLTGQKPAPIIQTRKSGTSQQARKVFKITRAGISLVEAKVS